MKPSKVILFILCTAIGWFTVNTMANLSTYNLYSDGKWESRKVKLAKEVWGAWAMMLSNIALKGGELNINAWHGYQELTLKKAVAAETVQFEFKPAFVPFSFIIDKTDSTTAGVLFWPAHKKELTFYIADATGKFLQIQNASFDKAQDIDDQKVSIRHTQDSVFVYINKVFAAGFAFVSPRSAKPGFKGSAEFNDLYIDNIEIKNDKGELVLHERFNIPFHINGKSILYLLPWAWVLIYCIKRKHLSSFTVYVNFVITAALIVGFLYYYHYISGNYSTNPDDIFWHGIKSNIETRDSVEMRIASEYKVEDIAGKKPVVVVIGSSQTWGAGVSSQKATYSSVLQDSLRSIYGDTNITVINTGISGITSDIMYENYAKKWAKYRPMLTLIDASNNDMDTTIFRNMLQAFATHDRNNHIKTMFIEEPNDDSTISHPRHLIMRSVARDNNITSIEVQSYLQQYRDSGYLWWDNVHMTDYGYQILARRILPYVVAEWPLYYPSRAGNQGTPGNQK